ncbi:hypothetical protein PSEUDO9AZ_40168 [Pseudomonas sp. 9AZ]|nr:hypothetical protein PSEUDO9AZ_40168 [Pseudomonas sp. 9AZ]
MGAILAKADTEAILRFVQKFNAPEQCLSEP